MIKLQADYDLQTHNTLAVPARCRWFAPIQSLNELQTVLHFAKRKGCSVLPIGAGSNIVFADFFPGVVVQNRRRGIVLKYESATAVIVEIGGGENWHDLVECCLKRGWYGIENLALIPGTVGAAPVQNIGAYGVELKAVLHSLVYAPINTATAAVAQAITLSKAQCRLAYRDSLFKQDLANRALILSLRLKLSKQAVANSRYPAVADWLNAAGLEATPQTVFTAVCALRRSKLPDPKIIPNAGSFFKNPIVSTALFRRLEQQFAGMPHFDMGNQQIKLAAAWMIEQAAWKGRDCATTGMHREQALVLVNPAKASGKQVLAKAEQVADSVAAMFNIRLEIEPRIYP